jgi:type IV pilus assembly protein PilB
MGVPSYLVASSVIAIMGQRLIRVVCQKCKQTYKPSEAALASAGITPTMAANATFVRGRGCSNCGGTGYRGRLGIFELMFMSPKIRELTFNEAPTMQIRSLAVTEGMRTLYADGLQKVCRGVATLEEVVREAKTAAEG